MKARNVKGRAYVLADQDVEFLNADETRGVRLELEYQKAESQLRSHGVRQTVLVMGSTRIMRSNPYYAVARELGRIVGRRRGAAIAATAPSTSCSRR